jgi:hypothetical protein
MRVSIFKRDDGVICYVAPIFGDKRCVYELPSYLLSLGVPCYWASERSGAVALDSEAQDLPANRGFTLLIENNASSLVQDFLEHDIDGDGRFITIVAMDGSRSSQPLDYILLQPTLERFAAHEEGPIRMVMVKLNDTFNAHIFVPHKPIETVGMLLVDLGLTSSTNREIRSYKSLRLAKLESLFSLLT